MKPQRAQRDTLWSLKRSNDAFVALGLRNFPSLSSLVSNISLFWEFVALLFLSNR